jgi:hypothetical protein
MPNTFRPSPTRQEPGLFSIVIPTRNRPHYLKECLATCVVQDDAEIIVADNSDDDVAVSVRQIVESHAHHTVRYIRPPGTPIAMTANWNYGLSHATGDYVTVVGDDDGLLPFCVRTCKSLARATNAQSIRWPWVYYTWPTFIDKKLADKIYFDLPRQQRVASYRLLSGRKQVQSVINNRSWYTSLPMLYNSFVKRSLLESLSVASGKPLDGQAPDIYSGIAVALSSRQYISIDYPLGIGGQGGKANGAAAINQLESSSVVSDFKSLNTGAGLSSPAGVVDAGVFAAMVTDSFVRFSQSHPSLSRGLRQDPIRLAKWQSDEVSRMNLSVTLRNKYKHLLLECFSQNMRCRAAINKAFAENSYVPASPETGCATSRVTVRASLLGIQGVADAARILGELLGEPTRLKPLPNSGRRLLGRLVQLLGRQR